MHCSSHVLEPDGGVSTAEAGDDTGEDQSTYTGSPQTRHQLLW